jgi:hypothetical protein
VSRVESDDYQKQHNIIWILKINTHQHTTPSGKSLAVYEMICNRAAPTAGGAGNETQTRKRDQTDAIPAIGSPNKKEKTQEYFLEIKWCVLNHDESDDWKETDYSMFFKEGEDFMVSPAILDNTKGENHEYHFTMCLVDSQSEHRRVLVEIETCYWTDEDDANLMEFNRLSHELADFCRPLWADAGRRKSEYSDIAIEFGESPHSGVEISTLVEEATGIEIMDHVMYTETVKMNPSSTASDSRKLLDMMFLFFPALVIAHESDLQGLGMVCSEFSQLGFRRIGEKWFVGIG